MHHIENPQNAAVISFSTTMEKYLDTKNGLKASNLH